MDEGGLDLSNPEVFPEPSMGVDLPSSFSMDSFFDEIINDAHHHACTHTHTCNSPGPDFPHTHTCFHVHTKILSAPTEETAESTEKSSPKKRPFSNREAVRKYREKKKARAASIEDEVVQLRAFNQQLMKRVQGLAPLEAEVARLRCLLVDLRGRIDGEIGPFPYQRPMKGSGDFVSHVTQANLMGDARVMNPCDFRCDDQVRCLHPGMQGKSVGESCVVNRQGFGVCDIGNIQCMGNSSPGSKGFLGCDRGNVMPANYSSNADEIEGACATTKG